MKDRLGVDGIDVTIFVQPSRAYGYFKVVMMEPENDQALTIAQRCASFARTIEPDYDLPLTDGTVPLESLAPLLDLIESTSVSLKPGVPPAHFFGGSFYSVTIAHGDFEVIRKWYGHLEDVEPEIAAIWKFVDDLIAEP